QGEGLPLEHGYLLYSALSGAVPAFHEDGGPRFSPITGERASPGMLGLALFSRLRVRLPSDRLDLVLPLSGRACRSGGARVRLGVPTVSPLVPAPLLAARIITYKHSLDPHKFLAHTRERLEALGVAGEPGVPLITAGPRAGEPRRRVLHLKGRRIVGYA